MLGVFEWLFDFVKDGGRAVAFLSSAFIDIGDGNIYTVLSLVSIGGITAYLVVAIVKWVIS